ncbi:MAG: mechanosensitive ion channel family protein [Gemmatimonadota bacterium]|nr:mechanosensitive ion channel family protein [Gemmatimonadota bacterium]
MGAFFSEVYGWLEARFTEIGQGNLLWAFIATCVLIVAAIFVMAAFRFLLRRMDRRLETWEGTHLRAVRLQKQELLAAEDTTKIARGVVRWIGYAVYAVIAYVALQLIFLSFPVTRGVGSSLLGSLADAVRSIGAGIIDFLPNIVFLAVLYFVATRTVKLVQLVFRGISIGRIKIKGFDAEWSRPTFKIIRFLIWVFFVIVAFPYLPGSESPAFRGVSIFLGVLFSLGSTGAAANFVSGIMLTYTRAFRISDRVRIGGVEGAVIDRTLFVTRVRTPKKVIVTVPNSTVMTSPVHNFSTEGREKGVFLDTTVTIGYDVPWRRVHELLLAAAAKTAKVETEPPAFVLQKSLEDFAVAYELNAPTREPRSMPEIYSELHQNIQDEFAEAGIEIASPHHFALRDGNDDLLPAEKPARGAAQRAFRFLGLEPGA